MSLSVVYARAKLGVEAPLVSVETHISNGLPALSIVGMPENSVRESKDRVRSALLNCQFEFSPRRITINLAPAHIPKEGSRFDLPIAIGLMVASEQIIRDEIDQFEFVGELALSGEIKPVDGILPAVIAAKNAGRTIFVPEQNASIARRVEGARIIPAAHLLQVCQFLSEGKLPEPSYTDDVAEKHNECNLDLKDVNGQPQAKRALEIAAAGGHHILFFGPPGTGKTMLASRLPSILPRLTTEKALEVLSIQSLINSDTPMSQWREPPFQSPHHTASAPALVGGGSYPKPGAVSLAHHGVLFLDELPEFQRRVIEVLRQPLESGVVTISRANLQVDFPSQFQLVAAMNPCPCGHFGNRNVHCRCTPDQIRRYLTKVSGPFLDRIDLHVELPLLNHTEILETGEKNESSSAVRQRVMQARVKQEERNGGVLNRDINKSLIDDIIQADKGTMEFLVSAIQQLNLSPRVFHRILKVARTIADLEGSEQVFSHHIAEALNLRKFERYLNNI